MSRAYFKRTEKLIGERFECLDDLKQALVKPWDSAE